MSRPTTITLTCGECSLFLLLVQMTNFPLFGVGDFTSPSAKPGGLTAQSAYVPDTVINPHPRFQAMTASIRERRGRKVSTAASASTKRMEQHAVKHVMQESDSAFFVPWEGVVSGTAGRKPQATVVGSNPCIDDGDLETLARFQVRRREPTARPPFRDLPPFAIRTPPIQHEGSRLSLHSKIRLT